MKSLSLFFVYLLPTIAFATPSATWRGYMSARANHYTGHTEETTGQRHRVQFEQETKLTSDFILINQVRWKYSSLYTDISKTPARDKENTHELYAGDNYFKYKSSSWVLQTGYQEVAWGEAFGFNYADIINPKDLRETFYSDYSESRLPLFLVNFKYFFTDGSLQLIYSPEPKFSTNLPVDLFTNGILPQSTITTTKQDGPAFFKEHEYGGKLAVSFWGLDASLFYYSYLDRDATYTLKTATLTTVNLEETHTRVKTSGLSIAKTIYDNFVFRTDLVYTQDKMINSVSGTTLIHTPVDMANALVSLDMPTYSDFTAVFIYASSNLSKNIPKAFREKNQNYAIAKFSYDFKEERIFDLSYTHEFSKKGHGVQALYTWPVNPTLELRMGGEQYWGESDSQLSKVKNISSVFFGIKNYFQL